jgi:hypothetical protein
MTAKFSVSIGHGRRASRNEWQRGGDFFSCEEGGEHEHLGATGPLFGLQRHASFADCVR